MYHHLLPYIPSPQGKVVVMKRRYNQMLHVVKMFVRAWAVETCLVRCSDPLLPDRVSCYILVALPYMAIHYRSQASLYHP